jgi:hypothetical protein
VAKQPRVFGFKKVLAASQQVQAASKTPVAELQLQEFSSKKVLAAPQQQQCACKKVLAVPQLQEF